MEPRKITLVQSNDVKTITSEATTLGELKVDLDNNGISYPKTNAQFVVGVVNQALIADDSVLPTQYKNKRGELTNNLVIMVTVTGKKFDSGYGEELTKIDLIKLFRDNGLIEDLTEKLGKLPILATYEQLADVAVAYGLIEEDTNYPQAQTQPQPSAEHTACASVDEIYKLKAIINNMCDAISTYTREMGELTGLTDIAESCVHAMLMAQETLNDTAVSTANPCKEKEIARELTGTGFTKEDLEDMGAL